MQAREEEFSTKSKSSGDKKKLPLKSKMDVPDLIDKSMSEEKARRIIDDSTKLLSEGLNPFRLCEDLFLYLSDDTLDKVAYDLFLIYDQALCSKIALELAADAYYNFMDIKIKSFTRVPDLSGYTNSYRAIIRHITSEILETENYAERILVIERWASILDKSQSDRSDHQTSVAIYGGLDQTDTSRLDKGVSKSALDIKNRVGEAYYNAAVRNKPQSFTTYGIPFLGVYEAYFGRIKDTVGLCNLNKEEPSLVMNILRINLCDIIAQQLLLKTLNDFTYKYRGYKSEEEREKNTRYIYFPIKGNGTEFSNEESKEFEAKSKALQPELKDAFFPEKKYKKEVERLKKIEEIKESKKSILKNEGLETIDKNMENIAIALKKIYMFIYEKFSEKKVSSFAEIFMKINRNSYSHIGKSLLEGYIQETSPNMIEKYEEIFKIIRIKEPKKIKKMTISKLPLDKIIKINENSVSHIIEFFLEEYIQENIREISPDMMGKYEQIFEKMGIGDPKKNEAISNLIERERSLNDGIKEMNEKLGKLFSNGGNQEIPSDTIEEEYDEIFKKIGINESEESKEEIKKLTIDLIKNVKEYFNYKKEHEEKLKESEKQPQEESPLNQFNKNKGKHRSRSFLEEAPPKNGATKDKDKITPPSTARKNGSESPSTHHASLYGSKKEKRPLTEEERAKRKEVKRKEKEEAKKKKAAKKKEESERLGNIMSNGMGFY